jgi:hypothetical protein
MHICMQQRSHLFAKLYLRCSMSFSAYTRSVSIQCDHQFLSFAFSERRSRTHMFTLYVTAFLSIRLIAGWLTVRRGVTCAPVITTGAERRVAVAEGRKGRMEKNKILPVSCCNVAL